MRKCLATVGATLALLFSSAPAGATILTFDVGSSSDVLLPDGYGDHVTAATNPNQPGWSYGEGNGFTPNVTISTESLGTPAWSPTIYKDGLHLPDVLSGYWTDSGILWINSDDGWTASLNSLTVAIWGNSQQTFNVGILRDDGPAELTGDVVLGGIGGSTSMNLNFASVSANRIGIQLLHKLGGNLYEGGWGMFGIDDVNFDQRPATVPEPGTLALASLGGVVGGLLRRRRTR